GGDQAGRPQGRSQIVTAVEKAADGTPDFNRREFLAGLSGLSGLVLIAGTPSIVSAEEAKMYGADGMAHGWSDNPLAFIAIGADGIVTVVVHRSEMGQGIRTSLPLIVADE